MCLGVPGKIVSIEPNAVGMTMGKVTYYFRTHFLCPTNPAGMTLRLQTFLDDGALVWLNGQPLFRQNLSAADPTYDTRADHVQVLDLLL